MTNRQIEESYNAMLPLYRSQMVSASGWVGDPLPWTYLGSTSFYIATADTDGTANLTANYPTGLKLTWQDGSGTPKYGYVGSSSAPGGTTNVYLVQSPDYTFSGSAITDRAYSRIAVPAGMPSLLSYACAWTAATTNPVLGNGTLDAFFRMDGRMTTAIIKLGIGSAVNTGVGAWRFSLPTPASTSLREVGSGQVVDASPSASYICAPMAVSATTVNVTGYNTAGFGTATPITWTTGDRLHIQMTYEAGTA